MASVDPRAFTQVPSSGAVLTTDGKSARVNIFYKTMLTNQEQYFSFINRQYNGGETKLQGEITPMVCAPQTL